MSRTAVVLVGRVREKTARGVAVCARTEGRVVAVCAGIGFDDDNPLRPWPWLSTVRREGKGTYYCLSYFGLWAGFRTERPRESSEESP